MRLIIMLVSSEGKDSLDSILGGSSSNLGKSITNYIYKYITGEFHFCYDIGCIMMSESGQRLKTVGRKGFGLLTAFSIL